MIQSKHAALVFIFSWDGSGVLLIRKTHPEPMKGKLNGVGGNALLGEDPFDCAMREVKEETGLETVKEEYRYLGYFVCEDNNSYGIFLYVLYRNREELQELDNFDGDTSSESINSKGEVLEFHDVDNVLSEHSEDLAPHCEWLIPMCINRRVRQVVITVV